MHVVDIVTMYSDRGVRNFPRHLEAGGMSRRTAKTCEECSFGKHRDMKYCIPCPWWVCEILTAQTEKPRVNFCLDNI